MRVRPLFLAWLCCLPFLVTPAQASEVNRVVAVVGDEVITSLDLDKVLRQIQQQVESAAAARPGEATPSEGQMRRMAMDRLIEDKIFDQEVKRAKLGVSQAELDMYVDRIKNANQMSNEEFLAQLSRRGVTPEEYKEDLKREILKHKLVERFVKSRVVISDKEVESFYAQQTGGAPTEGQVRLRAVFLKVADGADQAQEDQVRAQAQKLRDKVAGGADIAEVAKNYSQGPGADQGGDLGLVSPNDLLPSMRHALGQLKPGQISPVFQVPGAFAFMQLVDDKAAKVVASGLTPQLKEQIRQRLEQETLDKRFREWLRELRAKSYVRVIEQ